MEIVYTVAINIAVAVLITLAVVLAARIYTRFRFNLAVAKEAEARRLADHMETR
jgi:hypothetical protein